MIDLLLRIVINLLCGAIVMIWHELPKSVAAHFLTHSVFRKKKMELPSPLKYIDPIGLILFTFSSFGVGWQKPYEHNPNKLQDKERSLLTLALVGQVSSLLLMVFLLPVLQYMIMMKANTYIVYAVFQLMKFSLVLVVVNLLPVPPLDMSKIIHAISPNSYFRLLQNERYIHTAFILLVAFGIIETVAGQILAPLINYFI